MAVTLIGADGIFTRLGAIAQALNDANAILGGALTVDGRPSDVTATMVTKANNMQVAFGAGTPLYGVIDGLQTQLSSYQSTAAGWKSYLKTLAQNLLVKQVNADTPLAQQTVAQALAVLCAQMRNSSDSVKANVPALGSQTTPAGQVNAGTPTIVGTVKSGSGRYSGQEYALAETIRFLCSRDAQSGGAVANQEQFLVTGQSATGTQLDFNWPLGSGTSSSLTVIDPTLNNAGGTVLQNGSFETWTTAGSPPDNWNALAGTANTDYAKETGIVFATSTAALKIIGGTGTGASLAQVFNTTPSTTAGAGGTAYNIAATPVTSYLCNLQVKADVVPASGVLTVDLVDGSNTVINDDGGVANAFTITLSGITTSYAARSGAFRLPSAPPSTVKLRVRASTVIPAGSNVFVEDVALARAVPFYPSGPGFAIFRGAARPLLNDLWTMALSISAAGAFQRAAQRLWGIDGLGLYLPSNAAGAQTINENLIV